MRHDSLFCLVRALRHNHLAAISKRFYEASIMEVEQASWKWRFRSDHWNTRSLVRLTIVFTWQTQLLLSHSIFGWNSETIPLSYAPFIENLSLNPSHGPTSGGMLVLLSVSDALNNLSALVRTFQGVVVSIVGYQQNGVFCELPSSF